jgi:glycosyltransferase involved in cell wall biosynthesis
MWGDARMVVASRLDPGGIGGLAALMRGVGERLAASGRVVFCSEEDGGGELLPADRIVPRGEAPRWFWMRLASRPAFHGLLQTMAVWHYARALPPLPPKPPEVFHFVGTGWDFLGFGIRDLAARAGARFSVFPAVHAGAWGDDRIDLRLYRLADAVFCQSDHERRHLERLGLPPGRVVRCALPPMCSPDGDGRALRGILGIGRRPAVLFLGRREETKGYAALIEAWPLVLRRHPDAVLLLAGPGGEKTTVAAAAGDSVRDLGVVDEAGKAAALAACDVFCLPSSEESFGIVYAEAWSYGKPVVCGPAPATREWVRDGVSGLWSDGSPADIAGCLDRLLGDPDLRQKLGAAGKDYQARELTWDKLMAVHRNVFFGHG